MGRRNEFPVAVSGRDCCYDDLLGFRFGVLPNDEGVIHATTVTTATNKNKVRFIVHPSALASIFPNLEYQSLASRLAQETRY